jgi:hypothetical protein
MVLPSMDKRAPKIKYAANAELIYRGTDNAVY